MNLQLISDAIEKWTIIWKSTKKVLDSSQYCSDYFTLQSPPSAGVVQNPEQNQISICVHYVLYLSIHLSSTFMQSLDIEWMINDRKQIEQNKVISVV